MYRNRSISLEWTQSYKASPSRVGFLDLPMEIRDHIYNYAFGVPGAILVQISYTSIASYDLKGRAMRYKGQGPAEPQHLNIAIGLLTSCRQIHAESTKALYGRNVFAFPMSNQQFAWFYRSSIRHIVFSMEAGRGIYSPNVDEVCYWWRSVFFPNVVDEGTRLLRWHKGLESLTLLIKSDKPGEVWKPPFMMAPHKTAEHRIAMGARWLKTNCLIGGERLGRRVGQEVESDNGGEQVERLHQILRLEVLVPHKSWSASDDYAGSKTALSIDDSDAEWDHREFAQAFLMSKGLAS